MSPDKAKDIELCQRCNQQLVLDPSVSGLSQAQYALVTSSLPSTSASSPTDPVRPADKLAALPPSSREAARIWAEANGLSSPGAGPSKVGGRSVAESFVLLSESVMYPSLKTPNTQSFSPPHVANLTAHLHAILSANTPISHPLCTECTALLTFEFQKKAEELGRERDAYIGFEQGILRNRERMKSKSKRAQRDYSDEGLGEDDIEGSPEEWEFLLKRKEELKIEEAKLKTVLEEKEKELDQARQEEMRVKADEEQVEREENEFLLSHASLSARIAHLTSALNTSQTSLLLSRSLLAHLESTNVYNDAFQIGHVPLSPSSASNTTVGTINGLRLGGRPVVEWEEINAAWGLVALCLHRIADKVGCVFDNYKIVPLGSSSRIDELPPSKSSYELYASSDITPARLLQNRRFNHAIIAFLDCLRQLIEFGKKEGKGWATGNIEIHKDKISGHSIRLPGISSMPLGLPSMSIMGLGSVASLTNTADKASPSTDTSAEEGWTRACRAVLGVLKRVLVMESEADRAVISG
ncbi:hypothetical protein L204_100533 [Cryptococcus depauperatus]|nr:beclin 1 [Cryptococcus depauperatus CBS 7855]